MARLRITKAIAWAAATDEAVRYNMEVEGRKRDDPWSIDAYGAAVELFNHLYPAYTQMPVTTPQPRTDR